MKKILLFALFVGMLAGTTLKGSTFDEIISPPCKKLGRGIVNVGFGVLEIPMKVYDTNIVDGALASLSYGVLKGVCYFVAREVVGVVDIVTFPFPLPDCPEVPNGAGAGYGPIMTPEWVVDPDHNAFQFFYDDSSLTSTPY